MIIELQQANREDLNGELSWPSFKSLSSNDIHAQSWSVGVTVSPSVWSHNPSPGLLGVTVLVAVVLVCLESQPSPGLLGVQALVLVC